jgi:hypothetical protein
MIEIIIAFWLTTWGMIMWKLYFPSMELVGMINHNNIVYRKRYLGTAIFGLISLAIAPLFLHIIFLDSQAQRFQKSFVSAILGGGNE